MYERAPHCYHSQAHENPMHESHHSASQWMRDIHLGRPLMPLASTLENRWPIHVGTLQKRIVRRRGTGTDVRGLD